MNKIPRERIKFDIKDLLPGEKTQIPNHCLIVLSDGSAYVDKTAPVGIYLDSWDTSNLSTVIEKTQNGYKLHIYGDKWFGAEDVIAENYIKIEEIVDHGRRSKKCDKCKGFGIIPGE